MLRTLALLALCGLVAPTARAQRPIQLVTGKIAVSVNLGFGTMALDDFNSFIEDREREFQGQGIPMEWDLMRTGYIAGGGVYWRVNDILGFGAEGELQFKNRDNRYSNQNYKLIDTMKMQLLDFNGFIEFFIPSVPHLNFGLHAGETLATFRDDIKYYDYYNTAQNFENHLEFTGSGFSGGVFAGYRKPYGLGAQLIARIGYRMRKVGELDRNGSPAVDLQGDPIDFDFSGFYARVGVGFNVH